MLKCCMPNKEVKICSLLSPLEHFQTPWGVIGSLGVDGFWQCADLNYSTLPRCMGMGSLEWGHR